MLNFQKGILCYGFIVIAITVLYLCHLNIYSDQALHGLVTDHAVNITTPAVLLNPLSPFIYYYSRPTTDSDEEIIAANNKPKLQLNYGEVLKEWLQYVSLSRLNESNGYVIYSCERIGCGGWADRLKGIISAFILSVLLQRRFLINIEHPCKLTNVLSPASTTLIWDFNVSNISGSSNLFKLVGNSKDRQIVRSAIQQQNYTSLQLYKKLYITGNDLLFDAITSETFDQDQFGNIDKRYMVLESFYPLLYNNVFKLGDSLIEAKRKLFLRIGDSKLICAQMRIGQSSTIPKDVEMLKSKHRQSMLDDIIEFIQTNLSKRYTDYKVFITTDSEEIRQIAKSKLKDFVVDIPGDITHLDRSEAAKSCRNYGKVILDFDVLSHCHTSLISNSGFGYFGNLRRPNPFNNLYMYCRQLHVIRSKREWDVIRWKNQPC